MFLLTVSISRGNKKMGDIPSVSLPALITCISCLCNVKCYAEKIARLRPNVRAAYLNNLEILHNDPEEYWREVEAAIMLSRFFRFHVSGDIPDADYFNKMVEVAGRNDHCQILCFTKKYDLVNDFLANGGEIPQNLHVLFSGWAGLKMNNPFGLPEAHVRYRDGSTTATANAKECGGNCTECAKTEGGCWTLHNGEQIVFNEH